MNKPDESLGIRGRTGNARIGPLAVLTALTIFGFYLRLRCLGCLGFRWDEDLTSLAVKSLLADGIPDLPSGMIYTRFYPYQWVLAASAKLFGFSEATLRLPGVILSTALIPAGYWIAGKLFDRRVALIVAAGLALSFEQVEMARTARMYAPFFIVFTLAAYSIYYAYYQDRERIFSPWPVLLCLAALSLHQLAYSLAVVIALAIILNPNIKRSMSLMLQAGVIGLAFILTKNIQEHFFYRGQRLAQAGSSSVTSEQDNSSPLSAILNQIDLPDFGLALQVWDAAPVYGLVIALLGLASAIWVVRTESPRNLLLVFLALAAIVLSVLHQFNLVLIVLASAIVASGKGLTPDLRGIWLRAAVSCGVIFVAWIAVILAAWAAPSIDLPIEESGLRKMLRTLVDYPNFRLFWSYVLERPALALPLALGTAWAVDCLARGRGESKALFLIGAFWAPLFLNGIIDTKYEFFRYNLHVDVFFLVLCCAGLVFLPELWTRMRGTSNIHTPSAPTPALWAFTAVLISVSVNPLAAAMTSSRGYHETGYWYRLFDLDKYQDFSSPAAYVRERLDEEDRIFVLEPREYWNYIGRVDYWIMSDGYQSQTFHRDDTEVDLYIAVPVLPDIGRVREAFLDSTRGDIWLLFSEAQLETTPWVSDEIKDFLLSLRDRTVYVGRDQQTRVVRLPPDDPARYAGTTH